VQADVQNMFEDFRPSQSLMAWFEPMTRVTIFGASHVEKRCCDDSIRVLFFTNRVTMNDSTIASEPFLQNLQTSYW